MEEAADFSTVNRKKTWHLRGSQPNLLSKITIVGKAGSSDINALAQSEPIWNRKLKDK